jgi:hypothetical protein
MPNLINSGIDYFFHEGKENLEDCLRPSFEAAVRRNVRKLVIFTGIGEGPRIAIEKFRSQDCFADIKIIAVTFPCGQRFKEDKSVQREINRQDRQFFADNQVPILRAHLPFNPIAAHHRHHGLLGQDLTLIGNALSILCGSLPLCVQAALIACDAGEVEQGEHVIALTSDTAILVRSSPTERLLTDFVIREIICKPMSLTVSKREERLSGAVTQLTLEGTLEPLSKSSEDGLAAPTE